MDVVEDPSVGDWIARRLTGAWGSVTGVVPDGYDAYVRVLHPVAYGNRLLRWRDVAAATGRHVHPLVQWWRLVGADDPLDPISALWDGDPPACGALDAPDNQTLVRILAGHTTTPDTAYFAVWAGYGFLSGASVRLTFGENGHTVAADDHPTPVAARLRSGPHLEHPGRQYGLVTGTLAEAGTLAELLDSESSTTSANLMWPADRSWCVGSEIDFDSTLIGCSHAAAEGILACPELEAFAVSASASLQSDADTVNR